MTRILSDQQIEEACLKYQSGTPITSLATSYNVSHQAILGLLKRRNIERRDASKARRIFTVNHDFFNFIDNERTAYWLGFLAAGGCVYRNALIVGLSIKEKTGTIWKL